MTEQTSITSTPGTNGSQRRTIGLVLGGVVLVGLLGALAGVVFDGDQARERPSPGKVSPTDPAVLSSAPGPSADAKASEPLITGTTLQPRAGSPKGKFVTLAEGVRVWVPAGWELKWRDADEANLCSSELTCVYALVGTTEPTTEATEILLQSLDHTLSLNSSYSQAQISDVTPLQPAGSLVSFAMLDYTVMYVDNQGSTPIYGRHSVLVRQDGVVLVDDVRSVGGADQFNAELESWAEVLSVTQAEFAGN